MLDYGVVFCDTHRWLSCLYSATPIETISYTISDLKPVLLNPVHMSLMH